MSSFCPNNIHSKGLGSICYKIKEKKNVGKTKLKHIRSPTCMSQGPWSLRGWPLALLWQVLQERGTTRFPRCPLLWSECSKKLLPSQCIIRVPCCKQKKPVLVNLNRTDLTARMLGSAPHHQEGGRPRFRQTATQSKIVIKPASALTPGNRLWGKQTESCPLGAPSLAKTSVRVRGSGVVLSACKAAGHGRLGRLLRRGHLTVFWRTRMGKCGLKGAEGIAGDGRHPVHLLTPECPEPNTLSEIVPV